MSDGRFRVAVLQFPGTNCEYETAAVIRAAGMDPEVFRWNRPADSLDVFDGYVIPGGFSYQDRVRAGAIAAKKSICSALVDAAARGKPILGICNGAQVLVETGLVPGHVPEHVEMALAENRVDGKAGYHCDWVYIRAETQPQHVFSRRFKRETVIPIPVAHAEGRFVTRDDAVLERIAAEGQIGFTYCMPDGRIVDTFPVNPNGAQLNIAGLYNVAGNVLALMPHPERGAWNRQVPRDLMGVREQSDGPAAGMQFFLSMRDALEERRREG
ncbi:phosphoribosylformylglycinamidine synthase I [bacterium]|nr:phosphoribosylformylglycinamidine synthase I [candidate division CSSED10-310 bacterium]